MGSLLKTFIAYHHRLRDDIFLFCEALHFHPTWQQKQVLEAVHRGEKRIAVKSGQGTGKTRLSCVIGLWRAFRNPDALTVVTAPTMRQCRDVWLAEARRLMEQADPILKSIFEITMTQVRIAGRPKWGVELITATKPQAAQGKHQTNLTVIAEEASGIGRPLIEQFEGTLSNEDSLFLQIGNPNTRDCAFFDSFNTQRHRWATFTFNSEDATKIDAWIDGKWRPIVSAENVAYLEEKYGRDSDVFRIRVLGEFPNMAPNCVISSEDAEACAHTDPFALARIPDEFSDQVLKQIGIDFARFGADESAIYRRVGNSIVEHDIFSHEEPNVVVDRAFRMQAEADWRDGDCWYVPDAGGMGQGIMHRFHEAQKNVLEFHNNGRAFKSQEFDNKITEGWFYLASLMRRRKAHIPNDNRLIQQLSTRQYHTTKDGKLRLEDKEEYKRRMRVLLEEGGSPDRADGVVMTYYPHVAVTAQIAQRERQRKHLGMGRIS